MDSIVAVHVACCSFNNKNHFPFIDSRINIGIYIIIIEASIKRTRTGLNNNNEMPGKFASQPHARTQKQTRSMLYGYVWIQNQWEIRRNWTPLDELVYRFFLFHKWSIKAAHTKFKKKKQLLISSTRPTARSIRVNRNLSFQSPANVAITRIPPWSLFQFVEQMSILYIKFSEFRFVFISPSCLRKFFSFARINKRKYSLSVIQLTMKSRKKIVFFTLAMSFDKKTLDGTDKQFQQIIPM